VGECKACGFCYLGCSRSFFPLTKVREAYHGKAAGEEQERLGKFTDLFVARSLTDHIYREGTPGGTTTALLHFMMEKGYVEKALLTRGKHPSVRYCMHPEPYIAASSREVLQSSHSKFEISPVLAKLDELSQHKNAALVGTPCHIMALRKLQIMHEDAVLSHALDGVSELARKLTKNVRFAISINCFLNHTNMDEAFTWLGIDEKYLVRFNENVSKDLYTKALGDGKDWRWFFKNNFVTEDGREVDYDQWELGRRVLPSGCLLCNNLMVSKEADASIGFYGAETGVKEVGWNSVVVMSAELAKIFNEMVAEQKLERKPFLKAYGRTMRKTLEWLITNVAPTRDYMGVRNYLTTGDWRYPKMMKKTIKGPRKTYIMGLELVFLAQTLRKKIFHDGPAKELERANAFRTAVY
jgi:coenzyme F420-reducing hydrogenase beta subunit